MTHQQATNLWWIIHTESPNLNPQVQQLGNGERVVRLLGSKDQLFIWNMDNWMALRDYATKSSRRAFISHARRKVLQFA
jgi:hypothetical protein